MKICHLLKLHDPDEYLRQALAVYDVLKWKAADANDLRSWLVADASIESLICGREMLRHYRASKKDKHTVYWYTVEPYIELVEETDTIDDIMNMRLGYHVCPGPCAG